MELTALEKANRYANSKANSEKEFDKWYDIREAYYAGLMAGGWGEK